MIKMGNYTVMSAKEHQEMLKERARQAKEARKAEKTRARRRDFLSPEQVDFFRRLWNIDEETYHTQFAKLSQKKALILAARKASESLTAHGEKGLPISFYQTLRHALRDSGIKPGKITRRLNRAARKAYGPAFHIG